MKSPRPSEMMSPAFRDDVARDWGGLLADDFCHSLFKRSIAGELLGMSGRNFRRLCVRYGEGKIELDLALIGHSCAGEAERFLHKLSAAKLHLGLGAGGPLFGGGDNGAIAIGAIEIGRALPA